MGGLAEPTGGHVDPGQWLMENPNNHGLVIVTAATSNTSSSPRFCDGCTLHQSSCRNVATEISLSRNAVSARHFSTVYCSRHCHCQAIIFLSLSRIAFIADGDHNDSSAHCHWMRRNSWLFLAFNIRYHLLKMKMLENWIFQIFSTNSFFFVDFCFFSRFLWTAAFKHILNFGPECLMCVCMCER